MTFCFTLNGSCQRGKGAQTTDATLSTTVRETQKDSPLKVGGVTSPCAACTNPLILQAS